MNAPDFEAAREGLRAARAERDQAERDAFQAEQRRRAAARELASLERVADARDPGEERERERLAAEVEALEASVAARRREAAAADRAAAAGLEAFLPFTDPREHLGRLPDTDPVLLLPLRLETRFSGAELWVRVFPDDCWVETFEPTLTESELQSARGYWAARWAAAGVEPERRAAWRTIVTAHGAGRAAWVIGAHAPDNAADEPLARAPDEVLLAVPSEEALGDDEAAALAEAWEAAWRAGGDEAVARAKLEEEVGAERAKQLLESHRPVNLSAPTPPGTTRETATVRMVAPRFPAAADVPLRETSWSRPARVTALPERLVLIGVQDGERTLEVVGEPIPSPLAVGPDPVADEAGRLRLDENGRLVVPDELRWMVDFDRAIADGLGFRVKLTGSQARAGFDRLFVTGIRMESDARAGADRLEALLRDHRDGDAGLAVMRHGTPTNATGGGDTAFTRGEDADATFAAVHAAEPAFTPEQDPFACRDGQWLADWLGIDPELLQRVPGAGGTDQIEARAMNVALWPATLGAFLDAMLVTPGDPPQPLVPDPLVARLRAFFALFVSGRGALPAIRIGAQPYGILATTAFSRMTFPPPRGPATHVPPPDPFLTGLHRVLMRMQRDWSDLAAQAAHVGSGDDPHRLLLRVLGLEAASLEFDQRDADTRELHHNLLSFLGAELMDRHDAALEELTGRARGLLAELGWQGPDPQIVRTPFAGRARDLRGPVIDSRPLSETERLAAVASGERNYLRWLRDAAATSLDALRTEDGFTGAPPRALLYLLLKHALERAYDRTARELLLAHEVIDDAAFARARLEPAFVHVRGDRASESRWRSLYEPVEAVTGSGDVPLHRHITALLSDGGGGDHLPRQLEALDRLDVPTARLERAFVEHIDCCSYRLDAWLLGLVHHRVEQLRGRQDDPPGGVYLGAYGWLEDVRPRPRELREPAEGPDLDGFPDEGPPLRVDPANAGYALAPSLDHAVTAAVLRNGYLSNALPEAPDALAVNLSSQRVRVALELIVGLREGQPLGALLGYRLERGLHDRHDLPQLGRVVHDLRQAFPLVAERTETTAAPPGTPVEAIQARNVVDGLRLLERARGSGQENYPFGASLPSLDAPLRQAVNEEVARLRDARDALADVAVAEAVHQAVRGNHERAAAMLDAFGRGSMPALPEVVETPREGLSITHRVAIHLDPAAAAGSTPRARAEPALNAWLATVLPALGDVACRVAVEGGADVTVALDDLGLEPLDVLLELDLGDAPAMSALDDRVVDHVMTAEGLRPDAAVRIRTTTPVAGKVSLFELAALVRPLRTLCLRSRPLAAAELGGGEASLDPDRVADRLDELEPHRSDLGDLVATLEQDVDDGAEVERLHARTDELLALTRPLTGYGMPTAAPGVAIDARRRAYAAAIEVAADAVERWDERLGESKTLLDAYDALDPGVPEEERYERLQAIERLVSTVAELPLTTPGALRQAVGDKRDALKDRRDRFAAVVATTEPDVADVLAELEAARDAAPPLAEMDPTPLPLDRAEAAVRSAFGDLVAAARALAGELEQRMEQAAAALAGGGVEAVQAAGRALFGEEFQMIPALALEEDAGRELALAWGDDLLGHLRDDLGRADPVEDWLHGVARVREPLHAWESALVVAGALDRRAGGDGDTPRTLRLRPLQLPRDPAAQWLALEFPPEFAPADGRLLHTASYAADVTATSEHCGLLVDEWSETVPVPDVTAGLAFHFDRPSSEPPQSWLLVAPATLNGAWDWDELVGALEETLALARVRAVEPDLLDGTGYAPLLPATVFPVLRYQISMMVDLAANNGVYELAREG